LIRKWEEYLDRFDVPHGPATLHKLQRPSEVTASSADGSSDKSFETLESAFKKLYVKSPRPSVKSTPPATPTIKSPAFKPHSYFATPPPRPPPRTMMSPDGMSPSWNSGNSKSASLHEGSKITPDVINIDVKHPERNQEFEIDFVEQMKYGEYV
jgi:hypothetical protein